MDDYRKYRSQKNKSPAGREQGGGGSGYRYSSRNKEEYSGGRGHGDAGPSDPPPSYASSSYRKYGGDSTYSSSSQGYGGYGRGGGGGGRSAYAEDEEDEDVEAIKSQITRTKEDTRDTTRRAVAKLRETEDIATGTLTTLGNQSEQILGIERNLDLADMHADRAADRTAELKRLNKSIFAISIRKPWGGRKRKDAEIAKIQADQAAATARREDEAVARYQTDRRIREATERHPPSKYPAGGASTAESSDASDPRSRYMFEDEDPALEDEIDRNLDSMSAGISRLRGMGLAMNDELDGQNQRLHRIRDKTDALGEKVAIGSRKLEKIK
ncbi:MAG: hypothetical protein DHS80DRAFT_25350 [Piptocephalis tieghemiana]|nr:MAG: hypothetical protein DHS80DRAFT_25350 [Piptocephalis tieghemiana]